MTPEDQKYYDELFDTFATPGWKHITEKWKEVLKAKDSILSVPEGGLEERKGELTMLKWMMNFEGDHKDVYDDLMSSEVEFDADL